MSCMSWHNWNTWRFVQKSCKLAISNRNYGYKQVERIFGDFCLNKYVYLQPCSKHVVSAAYRSACPVPEVSWNWLPRKYLKVGTSITWESLHRVGVTAITDRMLCRSNVSNESKTSGSACWPAHAWASLLSLWLHRQTWYVGKVMHRLTFETWPVVVWTSFLVVKASSIQAYKRVHGATWCSVRIAF